MLFDPVNINQLTLKNRIVMPAINLGFTRDGKINDRLVNFYRERAVGGAGLIMVGGTVIDASSISGGFISLHDDSMIEGHSRLVQAIHAQNCRAGVQLFHAGRYSFGYKQGFEVIAPSAVPSRLTRVVPREMSLGDIRATEKNFGLAAERALRAGYDLVEIICSAGYLLTQFLSPLTNLRQDEYGGTLENRLRFPLEVIASVRAAAGGSVPISVRLGGSDFMPGGNQLEDMVKVAVAFEKAGINMINVTGGWHESYIPQIQSEVPRGAYTYLAAGIKQAVTIPVAASNRINTPLLAETILQEGKADLVSIARGFLADPHWALKASKGRYKSIRQCISCMTCLDRLFSDKDVLCAVNPQCGREAETSLKPTSRAKKVLIIGAGPAGLEAARVAAERQHEVTIWEKESHIGGQLNIAAVPPGKSEFLTLLDYYKNQLQELKVKIKLGCKAEVSSIKQEGFDAIIIAAGARPASPALTMNGGKVIDAWDVLNGCPVSGSEIAIIGGGSVGCETALYLANKGTLGAETLKFLVLHEAESLESLRHLLTRGRYHIKIIEMSSALAADMGRSTRWGILKQLKLMGIEPVLNSRAEIINENSIKINRNGEEKELSADTVVIAAGSRSNNSLCDQLQGLAPEIYAAGDAASPGKIIDAIHQAYEIANQL